MRVRTILQLGDGRRRDGGYVGIIFDDDGVRGITARDAWNYADGKPCLLLANADDPWTSPLADLGFCSATIVVTSPNLKPKPELNAWQTQVGAKRFVATPPSCLEVVYLLYVKLFNYR
jgi:hypothetical protein